MPTPAKRAGRRRDHGQRARRDPPGLTPVLVAHGKELLREAAREAGRLVLGPEINLPVEVGEGANWWEASLDAKSNANEQYYEKSWSQNMGFKMSGGEWIEPTDDTIWNFAMRWTSPDSSGLA